MAVLQLDRAGRYEVNFFDYTACTPPSVHYKARAVVGVSCHQ